MPNTPFPQFFMFCSPKRYSKLVLKNDPTYFFFFSFYEDNIHLHIEVPPWLDCLTLFSKGCTIWFSGGHGSCQVCLFVCLFVFVFLLLRWMKFFCFVLFCFVLFCFCLTDGWCFFFKNYHFTTGFRGRVEYLPGYQMVRPIGILVYCKDLLVFNQKYL